MISIDPYAAPRYEVQWRPFVNNGWQLMESVDSRESAYAAADGHRQRHGGQTRIVSQEVVHAAGLGASEFAALSRTESLPEDR